MQKYLFLPGNSPKYLNKIKTIKGAKFIIDFEDSIDIRYIEDYLKNLDNISPDGISIRISFRPENARIIEGLVSAGFSNFIVPKLETANELLPYQHLRDITYIILLEHPRAVINIKDLCSNENVVGIGIGSHDFCDFMDMEHNLENLQFLRNTALIFAKTFGLEAIDFASMNIVDYSSFREEITNGYNFGFDGKFCIHPIQVGWINDTLEDITKSKLSIALDLKNYIESIGGSENFVLWKYKGQVIEKAHLNYYRRILKLNKYDCF